MERRVRRGTNLHAFSRPSSRRASRRFTSFFTSLFTSHFTIFFTHLVIPAAVLPSAPPGLLPPSAVGAAAANRWYVYLGVVLASAYAVQPLTFSFIKTHIAEAFRIPSGGMAPTLEVGDYILTTPLQRTPARGRLAVYRSRGQSFITRVVGVGGDTLAMQHGQLLLNGQTVDEPYAQAAEVDLVPPEFRWQTEHVADSTAQDVYKPSLQTWGPLVVPPRQVFVLGDNRGNSADSRYIGFIPDDSVVARPTLIYFSRDADTGEIRWSRIGRGVRE